MADRIGPWRELTGDPTLDSIPTEAEMMVEIERRARLKDVADFDAKIRGEQLLDRVCAQHGHAAYVSWGDAR